MAVTFETVAQNAASDAVVDLLNGGKATANAIIKQERQE